MRPRILVGTRARAMVPRILVGARVRAMVQRILVGAWARAMMPRILKVGASARATSRGQQLGDCGRWLVVVVWGYDGTPGRITRTPQ